MWQTVRPLVQSRPQRDGAHDLTSVIDVERLSTVITIGELDRGEAPGGVQKSTCVAVPERRAHDLIQIIDTVRYGDDAVLESKGHNAFVREQKTESSVGINSVEGTDDMARVVRHARKVWWRCCREDRTP